MDMYIYRYPHEIIAKTVAVKHIAKIRLLNWVVKDSIPLWSRRHAGKKLVIMSVPHHMVHLAKLEVKLMLQGGLTCLDISSSVKTSANILWYL